MQSITPPTDSLYKFIAVFCLGLIIACAIAFTSLNTTHNRYVYEGLLCAVDVQKAEMTQDKKDSFSKSIMDLLLASKEDNDCLCKCLGGIIGASLWAAIWAFKKWYVNEQKIRDHLLRIELKERLAVGKGGNEHTG
jgi:hypothetical protein